MRILYIDTSSSYLYAGIVTNRKLTSEVKKEFGHSLSEEALPSIVSLFEKENLSAKDIDKIIVVNISGRGDKDVAAIARYRGIEIDE